MKTVLFRHAERQSTTFSNPPLSPRGEEQAQKLARLVASHDLPQPLKLLASPRLRSQQTLMPVARELRCEIQVLKELDERLNAESAGQFAGRIEKFLNQVSQQQGPVFFCTHLDWIEEALRLIPCTTDLGVSKYSAWAPGQYMEFEVSDGTWDLLSFGRIDL